jgi:DNA repair exonuclease SbcCD ATPase subunit
LRLKCEALQKSLHESQTSYRLLENQIIDHIKAPQRILRLQAELKVARAALNETEMQYKERCDSLERSACESQQQVQRLQLQLDNFHVSSTAFPRPSLARSTSSSVKTADRAAAGGNHSCCDGYRRRCEALQVNLVAEKQKNTVLSAQLGVSAASVAATEADVQTLMKELSVRDISLKSLQRVDVELREGVVASQEHVRVFQREAAGHESHLKPSHALSTSAAFVQTDIAGDTAVRVAELHALLQQTEAKLAETQCHLDEHIERRALEESSCRGCNSCLTLQARLADVESQLAAALGDLDASSFDLARTLRHAASALHELQQQLQGAREREAATSDRLLQKEAELEDTLRLIEELQRKEEEGDEMKRLHAEAAEVFLQQAQALQRCGKVCLKCLRCTQEVTDQVI